MTKVCACMSTVIVSLAVCLFLLAGEAHAYLDPGTGSYFLQLALAALVGALFLVKLFWTRVKSFFKKLLSSQTEVEPDEN